MSDETKIVTPSAPRSLTWWETAKEMFPNSRSMTREEAAAFRVLSRNKARRLYREEDMEAEREKTRQANAILDALPEILRFVKRDPANLIGLIGWLRSGASQKGDRE